MSKLGLRGDRISVMISLAEERERERRKKDREKEPDSVLIGNSRRRRIAAVAQPLTSMSYRPITAIETERTI